MANACLHDAPDAAAADVDREWFAVQVWTGREQHSVTELTRRGFEVFLPCYREHRRWSDRIKTIDRALFPGYLFCHSAAAGIGSVLQSPGIITIVGAGTTPLAVPTAEVDAIRQIVETRLLVEPWPFLQTGQRVRIERGPLRGTEGVVLAWHNGHRLVISVPLLQRSIAVELDPTWVSVSPLTLIAG
jgi:transcription antitermination factor NusG